MKPSKFIGYAERKLDRCLTEEERTAVMAARINSVGKRAGVKSMRTALERLLTRPL